MDVTERRYGGSTLAEFLGVPVPCRSDLADSLAHAGLHKFTMCHHKDSSPAVKYFTHLQRPIDALEPTTKCDQSTARIEVIYHRIPQRSLAWCGRFWSEEVNYLCDEFLKVPRYMMRSKIPKASWKFRTKQFVANWTTMFCVYGDFDYDMAGNHQYIISFDPATNLKRCVITEAIEGIGDSHYEPRSPFLQELHALVDYIEHPMLIPLIFAGQRMRFFEQRRTQIYEQVLNVQRNVNLVTCHVESFFQYMESEVDEEYNQATLTPAGIYERAHVRVLDTNMDITNTSNPGTLESVKQCAVLTSEYVKHFGQCKCEDNHVALAEYIGQLGDIADRFATMQEALASRNDRQHQAVYHQVYKLDVDNNVNIAKTVMFLALLGAIFMPAQVVADIFGMQPFFGVPGSLEASSNVWIYFVIVLGVTLTLLLALVIYKMFWPYLRSLIFTKSFWPTGRDDETKGQGANVVTSYKLGRSSSNRQDRSQSLSRVSTWRTRMSSF